MCTGTTKSRSQEYPNRKNYHILVIQSKFALELFSKENLILLDNKPPTLPFEYTYT